MCKVSMALVSCLCYQSAIIGLFLICATLVMSLGHLGNRKRVLCCAPVWVPVFLECVLHARLEHLS